MGLTINIRNQEFRNEPVNGSDFSANASSFSVQPLGGVMQKVQLKTEVAVEWNLEASGVIVSNSGQRWELQSATFSSGNIVVGDRVVITRKATAGGATFTTAYDVEDIINDDVAIMTHVSISGEGSHSDSIYDAADFDFLIRGVTPLTGLIWPFGFIENNEVFNTLSKLDNTSLQYYFEEVGEVTGVQAVYPTRDTTTEPGEWNDTVNGSQTGSITAKFLSWENDGFGSTFTTETSVQVFEIVHEFIQLYYWRDGEASNLQNLISPTDLFSGNKSMKYVASPEFRNVYSNPNNSKSQKLDSLLGSVGYFDEVFNGFNKAYNNFQTTFLNVDTGLSIDALNTGAKTRVTMIGEVLNGSNLNTVGEELVAVVYHSKLPTSAEYSNQKEAFQNVWLYESLRNEQGAPAANGDILTNLTVAATGTGTTFQIKFDVEFNATQKERLNGSNNYVLAVSLVNTNKDDVNVSTLQTLLIDFSEYIQSSDVPGLITDQDLRIYAHQTDVISGQNKGFKTFEGWNEDGIVTQFDFSRPLSEVGTITNLRAALVGYDETTDDSFEIDSFDVPLGTPTTGPNGEQIISNTSTRGFNLAPSSQFNQVELISKTFDSGNNKQPYTARVPFKIPWADWQELLTVPEAFVDQNEPFNGKNKKSSRFSNVSNYKIKVFYFVTVEQEGVSTIYRHISGDLNVYDYLKDDTVPADWVGIIETFKQDGTTPTNLKILSNEPTKIKVTFAPNGFNPTLADYYGIVRLEPALQQGFDIDESSTLRGDAPTPRIANATISKVGFNLIVEAETVPANLEPGQEYNISSRLGLNQNDNNNANNGRNNGS